MQEVVCRQRIPMDFNYYFMNVPIDAPSIVVSSVKSVLSNDPSSSALVRINLPPLLESNTNNSNSANYEFNFGEYLENSRVVLREWWSLCRYMNTTMSEDTCSKAIDIFVDARKSGTVDNTNKNVSRECVTPEDFQMWLKLARLIAISNGERNITELHLQRAMDLEEIRSRLERETHIKRPPLMSISK